MFTAQRLRERMEEKPLRPFRIRMTDGNSYEIKNHDAAWVLRNAIESAWTRMRKDSPRM
ncbi:MAG TPA: hypothetical protein VFM25_09655 [Verrucomicrobiae bacterium]|nr:hypothetical protein [Verrucomicrobiae bacterium]